MYLEVLVMRDGLPALLNMQWQQGPQHFKIIKKNQLL